MVTAQHVQAWLDSYVEAWRTYDPVLIGSLFAADATYAYHPWDEPIRGREAIVADWVGEQDEPGTWEAEYYPLLIAENGVAARGRTRYASGKVYENLWLLGFDDEGLCTRFVEWYMVPPESAG
jgi:hypothetical protein